MTTGIYDAASQQTIDHICGPDRTAGATSNREPIDAPLLRINPAAAEVRGTADIGLAMEMDWIGWIAADVAGIRGGKSSNSR